MNFWKSLFLFSKKSENIESLKEESVDKYYQIAKLVKEARIQQNLTIQELSDISKIPQQAIKSIENNTKKFRPDYPFIRSILIKLEKCLDLKKNSLVKLAIKESEIVRNDKKDFLVSKFDIINTWQGSVLYFLLLISTIFMLKRYFISNVNIIEIQNIENKIIDK